MATLKLHLRGAQSAMLAAASLAVSAVLGAMLVRFAAGRQDLLVWCRDFVLASVGGSDSLQTLLSIATVSLAVISLLRAAVFLAGEWVRARRLRSHVHRSRVATPGRVLAAASGSGIGHRIVIVADDVPSAFTFGLVSPVIVLTSALVGSLTLEELRAVIAHERLHLRRKDPLRSLFWETFRQAFFFLPVFGDVASFAALRREIRADGDAEAAAGRRALASALLKAVSPVRSAALVAPFGHLRTRIRALALPATARAIELSTLRIAVSAAVAALIVVANLVYASPVRARDGTLPSKCGEEPPANMSRINFSAYLRIDLGPPSMSSAVQSSRIAP